MGYSFNIKMDKANMAFAQRSDVNASYKDLGAVCDAVRYVKAGMALKLLDRLAEKKIPVPYRRHNKHMGARSELHGRKGAYPIKAAKEVRIALQNAIANAANNAMDGEDMVIVHACANKTRIERRYPSKGGISWGRGMYGQSATMHSNLEYAKIEIALAYPDSKELSKNMKYFISRKGSLERIVGRISKDAKPVPKPAKKEQGKAQQPAKAGKKPEEAKSAQEQPKKEQAAAKQEKRQEPANAGAAEQDPSEKREEPASPKEQK